MNHSDHKLCDGRRMPLGPCIKKLYPTPAAYDFVIALPYISWRWTQLKLAASLGLGEQGALSSLQLAGVEQRYANSSKPTVPPRASIAVHESSTCVYVEQKVAEATQILFCHYRSLLAVLRTIVAEGHERSQPLVHMYMALFRPLESHFALESTHNKRSHYPAG